MSTLQDTLEAKGFVSREHYLMQLSEDFDLDAEGVILIAELLGDEELFDGLPTALGEMASQFDFGGW